MIKETKDSRKKMRALAQAVKPRKAQAQAIGAYVDRKIARNMLRARYGNKGLRQTWMALQIKEVGIKTYVLRMKATDPKKRHSAQRFPDLQTGAR